MSDYLANLAARTIAPPILQPRLPSRFEPASAASAAGFELATEDVVSAFPAVIPQPPLAPPPASAGRAAPAAALAGLPLRPAERARASADQAPTGSQLLTPSPVQPSAGRPTADALAPAVLPSALNKPLAVPALEPAQQRSLLPPPRSSRPAAHATGAAQPQLTPASGPKVPAPAAPATTIHVTIGRIEIRAAPPAQTPQRQRTAPAVMSLEEYLRRRNGGGQ